MTHRVWTAALAVAMATGASQPAQDPYQDVIRNLRHPKPEIRLDAVDTLNEHAYAAAAEAVAPLVVDPDDRVQLAAIDAELTFFLAERINPVKVMGIGNQKSRAQEAFDGGPLIRGSSPAPAVLIDKLMVAMRDENARVRFDAVHALGFIAEPPMSAAQVTALAAELDHYDPIMRAATARVLGRWHAREAADRLVVATVDTNALVRQFAVAALGRTSEPRVLPQVRQMITHAKGALRPEAYLALAELASNDDLGLMRTGLTDKDPEVRRAAAEGVGRLGDRGSQPTLESLLKGDREPSVRLAAAFGLVRFDAPQTPALVAALADRDLAGQATDYLFEIGKPAVPALGAALTTAADSKYRADLLQAIGYLGTRDDIVLVDPFMKDKDERVSRAAIHAAIRLRRGI